MRKKNTHTLEKKNHWMKASASLQRTFEDDESKERRERKKEGEFFGVCLSVYATMMTEGGMKMNREGKTDAHTQEKKARKKDSSTTKKIANPPGRGEA